MRLALARKTASAALAAATSNAAPSSIFFSPSGASLRAGLNVIGVPATCSWNDIDVEGVQEEASARTPRDFIPALYARALKTKSLGQLFLYSKQMPSTQTAVYDSLGDLKDGFACLADVQTSGKGRGGNTWTSPLGCLMCTFVTSFKDGKTLPFVQYLVTIAIIRARAAA